MRRDWLLGVIAAASLLGNAVTAQQPSPAPPRPVPAAGHGPAASPATPFRAVATVQDIMADLIDPASKVVFNAVSSQTTTNGTVDTAPKNDDEWAVVRRSALILVEGANLLVVPGRHMARPENAKKANEGELPPAEIEVRVAKDRAAWNKFAAGFRQAAMGALKAAETRKTDAFGPASEAIDNACESCHLRFWYPDQEKLFEGKQKPK